MIRKLIDISVLLDKHTPVWPDSSGFRTVQTLSLDNGDQANVTRLECDVHVGTHIDAPRHFLQGGTTVDDLPLEMLMGPAVVVILPRIRIITSKTLELLNIPPDTQRLLLRTRNSRMWKDSRFNTTYTALSPDAAQWIVDRKISLVGIDYLSVEKFGNRPDAHRILLGANVIILEGLDLTGADAGEYELICLPIRLANTEGAPVRAVLRSYVSNSTNGGTCET